MPVLKKKKRIKLTQLITVLSLLSVVSKILELIFAEQLTHHLHEHHLLYPRQLGFRKGRSVFRPVPLAQPGSGTTPRTLAASLLS